MTGWTKRQIKAWIAVMIIPTCILAFGLGLETGNWLQGKETGITAIICAVGVIIGFLELSKMVKDYKAAELEEKTLSHST
jgi:hypothetical protein